MIWEQYVLVVTTQCWQNKCLPLWRKNLRLNRDLSMKVQENNILGLKLNLHEALSTSPNTYKVYYQNSSTDVKRSQNLHHLISLPLLQLLVSKGIQKRKNKDRIISWDFTFKNWLGVTKRFPIEHFYIDNGRSILRFFFLASVTCFAIVIHTSNSKLTLTRINASFRCVKYNETTEKTRSAKITSSHITNMTTSALHQGKRRRK